MDTSLFKFQGDINNMDEILDSKLNTMFEYQLIPERCRSKYIFLFDFIFKLI